MALKDVIIPTALPIHLDVVKDHLKVDTTDEDALISAYLSGAVELLQSHTNRQLVTTVKDLYLDALTDCIDLYEAPLSKINAVYYTDEAGDELTLTASLYDVDMVSAKGRITRENDSTYPDTKVKPNAVRVRHSLGYITPFSANAGDDTITAANHPYSDGDVLHLSNSGGVLPAGLAENTTYYVIASTATTLQLSATSGGAAVDITDAGTGINYLGVMPENFKSSILLVVGHLYHNREDSVSKMPKASEYLLKNYVIYN